MNIFNRRRFLKTTSLAFSALGLNMVAPTMFQKRMEAAAKRASAAADLGVAAIDEGTEFIGPAKAAGGRIPAGDLITP